METALHIFGAMIVVDLIAAFVLVGFVALVGQRGQRRVPFSVLLGALIFLGVCSTFIYGGLWMLLKMGRG